MRDVIIQGDALALLKTLEENSVDALCCDPPAGISFMGKDWDNPNTFPLRDRGKLDGTPEHAPHCHDRGFANGMTMDTSKRARDTFIDFMTAVFAECLRVVKPGGHALVWALPRTSHWTATALEDAGWQIRDICSHAFGSGFPKSKNLGNGQGSALKPAVEFWILARKPLAAANLASNVLEWSVGGLNIDACRVGTDRPPTYPASFTAWRRAEGRTDLQEPQADLDTGKGRWPPNFLLSHSAACSPAGCSDDCPVAALDEQAGERKSGGRIAEVGEKTTRNLYSDFGPNGRGHTFNMERSGGGPSRFFPVFYCSKASRRERNAGCEGLPEQMPDNAIDRATQRLGLEGANGRGSHSKPRANFHPTVKSVSLMSWLVRLITPPGGIVLDCFAGSGSTLVACVQEGFHYIGLEQDASYIEIARARIAHAHQEGQQHALPPKPISLAVRRRKRYTIPDMEQLTLFA